MQIKRSLLYIQARYSLLAIECIDLFRMQPRLAAEKSTPQVKPANGLNIAYAYHLLKYGRISLETLQTVKQPK